MCFISMILPARCFRAFLSLMVILWCLSCSVEVPKRSLVDESPATSANEEAASAEAKAATVYVSGSSGANEAKNIAEDLSKTNDGTKITDGTVETTQENPIASVVRGSESLNSDVALATKKTALDDLTHDKTSSLKPKVVAAEKTQEQDIKPETSAKPVKNVVLDREPAEFSVRALSDGFRVRWKVEQGDKGEGVLSVQYRLDSSSWHDMSQEVEGVQNKAESGTGTGTGTENVVGEYTIDSLRYSTSYNLAFRVVYEDVVSLPVERTFTTLALPLDDRHPLFVSVLVRSNDLYMSWEYPWWLSNDQVVAHEYRLVTMDKAMDKAAKDPENLEDSNWQVLQHKSSLSTGSTGDMVVVLDPGKMYSLQWRTVYVDAIGRVAKMQVRAPKASSGEESLHAKYYVVPQDANTVEIILGYQKGDGHLGFRYGFVSPDAEISWQTVMFDEEKPQSSAHKKRQMLEKVREHLVESSYDTTKNTMNSSGSVFSEIFTHSLYVSQPGAYTVACQSLYSHGKSHITYLYFETFP